MKIIKHKFVEFIPNVIEEGCLYISVEYKTAVHLCACGCGNKVITPITPTDWKITFNGKTVSLYPSIGNWGFECKSHYLIINNEIRFVRKWRDERIDDDDRKKDSNNKRRKWFRWDL